MAINYVRPGSKTANGIINRKESAAGAPPKYPQAWWVQRVRYSNFTSAATSQALSLNATFTANPFPPDAFIQMGAYVDLIQVFSGGAVTAATVILGDAGATNGLLTISNVWTGATTTRICTPAATEYDDVALETQFVPLLTLVTTTANVNVLTQGILDVYIPYSLAPSRRGA